MDDELRELLRDNILERYDNEEYWDEDITETYEAEKEASKKTCRKCGITCYFQETDLCEGCANAVSVPETDKDKECATYVEIAGTFTFGINQSGLDFNDPKERQSAVDDFWETYEEFVERIADIEGNYLRLSFDAKKIKVEKGEY